MTACSLSLVVICPQSAPSAWRGFRNQRRFELRHLSDEAGCQVLAKRQTQSSRFCFQPLPRCQYMSDIEDIEVLLAWKLSFVFPPAGKNAWKSIGDRRNSCEFGRSRQVFRSCTSYERWCRLSKVIFGPAHRWNSHNVKSKYYECRKQVSSNRRNSQIHCWRRRVKPRLVAEPVEARSPAPTFLQVQSDGRGLHLRRRVQEPRSCGCEKRSRSLGGRRTSATTALCSFAWRGTAPAPTGSVTAAAAAAGASNASLRSTVGRTTSAWTKRVACSGRSSRSTAGRFHGPT